MNRKISSNQLSNRRHTKRVAPAEDNPVIMYLNGKKYPLINISTGGLSFENDTFEQDDWHMVDIKIGSDDVDITAVIEIVSIDESNVCHCRFKSENETNNAVINRFVSLADD